MYLCSILPDTDLQLCLKHRKETSKKLQMFLRKVWGKILLKISNTCNMQKYYGYYSIFSWEISTEQSKNSWIIFPVTWSMIQILIISTLAFRCVALWNYNMIRNNVYFSLVIIVCIIVINSLSLVLSKSLLNLTCLWSRA